MRLLLKTFALLGLLPYAGSFVLVATGAASRSSVAYVTAVGLVLGGLVTLPDRRGVGLLRHRPRQRRGGGSRGTPR